MRSGVYVCIYTQQCKVKKVASYFFLCIYFIGQATFYGRQVFVVVVFDVSAFAFCYNVVEYIIYTLNINILTKYVWYECCVYNVRHFLVFLDFCRVKNWSSIRNERDSIGVKFITANSMQTTKDFQVWITRPLVFLFSFQFSLHSFTFHPNRIPLILLTTINIWNETSLNTECSFLWILTGFYFFSIKLNFNWEMINKNKERLIQNAQSTDKLTLRLACTSFNVQSNDPFRINLKLDVRVISFSGEKNGV